MAVLENNNDGTAIMGKSTNWMGVVGASRSTNGGHGVLGTAFGTGVAGVSETWCGVYGETTGTANGPAAIWGDGKEGAFGVKGHARAQGAAGVAGYQLADRGPGIFGKGNPAGMFEGDVTVSGRLVVSNIDVRKELKALRDAITALQNQINALSGRITSTDNRLSSVDARLGSHRHFNQ
ncbi:hypothetical protein ACFV7Q_38560 [Streptomyces sp. NPDC059851]|uniref:hypothetical protein n=1 Tax=Streptomyces sp. NPDC059851 TaxID=3346971 RepID=UPI003662965B